MKGKKGVPSLAYTYKQWARAKEEAAEKMRVMSDGFRFLELGFKEHELLVGFKGNRTLRESDAYDLYRELKALFE